MELPATPSKRAELMLHIVHNDVKEAISDCGDSPAGEQRQVQLTYVMGFVKAAQTILRGGDL